MKMKKIIGALTAKFTALALALTCVGSVWAADPVTIQDASGNNISVYEVSSGFYQDAATYTASRDFYITSKAGLEYFRDLVNQVGTVADTYVTTYVNASWTAASWYTENIFTGKTVHLMTDVDLGNVEWSPIGQPKNAAGDKRCFYGNFDGERHKVSNLKATTYTEATKTWYAGLFGNVAGTQTFSNLTIENVTLVGYDYAGAIIGNAGSNATAFNNCHVKGNIDIKCTMVGAFVGGIVGIGTSAIDDCSVKGNTGSTIEGSTVGGLAGTSTRTAKDNANTVTDSTVTGVTVKSDDNGGQAGGLVGKATNPVTVTGNTVNDVTVSAEAGTADVLVGGVGGDVTASSNTTDTNVTVISDPYAAYVKVADGFYQNAATYKDSTDFYITNLNGLKYFRDIVNGVADVCAEYVSKGFSGYATALQLFQNNIFQDRTVHLLSDLDLSGEQWVTIGYQDVDSKGLKNLIFYGTFDAGIYDGNGNLTGTHKISNLDVAESYAADGSSLKRTYTGLFGRLAGGTATGVKNLTIENARVSGRDYVGAIAGRIYQAGAVIENCHVIGAVSINGTSAWVGGLVGECRGSIVDSSVDATGTISGRYDVGGLAGGLYQYGYTTTVSMTGSSANNVTVSAGLAYGLGGLVGVAGLAGDNYTANVTISGNTANNVTVTTADANYAGKGLVGTLVGYANENSAYAIVADNTVAGTTSATENGTAITTQIGADNATSAIVGTGVTFDESGKVTGGIFENIPASAIASGYVTADNPNTETNVSYPLTIGGPYKAVIYDSDTGKFKQGFDTLAAALSGAADGETITLISGPDEAISAEGEVTGNKTIYITGTAKFNWEAGWLMVGRGSNPGNGTLIFTNATIYASQHMYPGSTGFNISGHEKGSATKNDGTIIVVDSYIECNYLSNKGVLKVVGNGTVAQTPNLSIYGGFDVAGRPASETESGEDATASVELSNGAYLQIVHMNGLGVGREGKGVVLVTQGSKLEHTTDEAYINIANKGTLYLDATSQFVGHKMNRGGTIEIDATGVVSGTKIFDLSDTSSLEGDVTVKNLVAPMTAIYDADGDVTLMSVAAIVNDSSDALVGRYETLAEAVEAYQNGYTIIVVDKTQAIPEGWMFKESGNVTTLVKPAAKIGETKYATLAAALADVTKDTPLTWVSEDAWPSATPVYVLETAQPYSTIDAGDKVNGNNTVSGYTSGTSQLTVYCRPGASISAGSAHWLLNTSITIYGNNASLASGREPDLGTYFDMTAPRTINIYNLEHAGVWGNVDNGAVITINVENCANVHEVLVQGGNASSVVNTTVANCSFDSTNGAHITGVSQDCGGSVTVTNCTFANMLCGINIKNDTGALDISIVDCTFTDCGLTSNSANSENPDLGAPIRIGSKEGATSDVTISGATFAYTDASPSKVLDADIVIGDNRTAKDGAGIVTYDVSQTSGDMKVVEAHVKNETPSVTSSALVAANDYSGDNTPIPPVARVVTNNGATTNKYADLHAALEAGKASGTTITLLTDVDLSGVNWVPVGTSASPFTGVFDGNGKTISNLSVNDEALTYAGLLGYVTGSTFKNITISNVTVNAAASIGSLMGYCNTSSVTNCHVQGRIQLSGHYKMGGILGEGYTNFTDCSVIGDGESTSSILATPLMKTDDPTKYEYEADNIGGMVGHWSEGTATIKNCTVKDISVTGYRKIGGMVAISFCSQKIEDVTVENVKVTCTAPKAYAEDNTSTTGMGGIVGQYHRQGGEYTGGWMKGATVKNVTLEATDTEALGIIKAGLVSSGLRDTADAESPIVKASMTFSDIAFEGVNSIPEGVKTLNDASFGPVAVAQIGTTKYETVEAALADAQVSGATIEILADSIETPDHALEVLMGGNITLTSTAPVRVEIAPTAKTSSVDTDGMAYIRSASADVRRTFTIGENVTLVFPATAAGAGAMYVGYSSANAADMVINGRLELYEPYVGSLSTLTVNPSGSIKSISECLIVRWGAKVDIIGTGAAWSDANPQAEFGYVWLQGGVTTLKDTYAKGGAWVQTWNRDADKVGQYGDTTLALDNSVLATSKIDNQVVIAMDCDSQIVTPVVQNTGSINIDATGITAPFKAIDYTGSGTMALANYGTVNVTAGEAYVEENDLWVKKLPVAQIVTDAGATTTKYATLAAAVADAQSGDTIEMIADVTGESVTVAKSVTITVAEGESHPVLTDTAIVLADGSDVALLNLAFRGDSVVDATAVTASITMKHCDVDVMVNAKRHNLGRKAFLIADNNSTKRLSLDIENNVFVVNSNSDYWRSAIFSWVPFADGSVIKDNVFGSADSRFHWMAIKFMNIVDGATLRLEGNTFYGDDGYDLDAVVFDPVNTSSLSASIISVDNVIDGVRTSNTLYAFQIGKSGIHVWDCGTTINGVPLTIANFENIGGANALYGVGVTFDNSGMMTAGTFNRELSDAELEEFVAEGLRSFAVGDGTYTLYVPVAQIGDVKYASFEKAIADVQDGETIVVLGYNAETMVAPEGWKFVTENDVTTLVKKAYVAQIGTTEYTSLFDAAAAVSDGDTITMIADSVETREVVFAFNGSATLDLNGHTVSANDDIWVKTGNITVVGGAGSAVTSTGYGFYVSTNSKPNNAATLTIDSDNVTVTAGTYGVVVMSGGSFNLVNGHIVSDSEFAVCGHGTATNVTINISGGSILGNGAIGVYFPPAGALNISGGTITGTTAIYQKCGTMTITGGTILGTGTAAEYAYNDSGANATGDAVVLDNCNYQNGVPSATITGGTFISANAQPIASYAGNGETELVLGFVSGGYLSSVISAACCADNYTCTTKPVANGMYQIVPAATVTYTLAGDGDPTGAALPSPASFAYPSGDLAEIALAVATCTSSDYTFAGWKVGGEGAAIASLPAGTTGDKTLVASWTKVKTVTVTESETSVPIKVTDEWLKTNNLETAETDAIQDALNAEESNGLKAWENYVLGLDGSDPDAKIAADAAQGSVSAMPVTSNVDVPPVDTGFTVEYKLVSVDTNGTTVTQSALQPTPDLTADIAAMTSETNVVYYKTVAVITSTSDDSVKVEVPSTNTIGVLKVESGAKTTAIAVPWEALGGGDISVSNIVRTANLTPGDELMAYAPDGSGYKAWELDANKVWQPVTVAGGSSETEADAYTVRRGSAVWLKRQDTTQPIYLVGEVAATEKAAATLGAGTAESPSWNLVGSAGTEPVNVNAIGAATTDKIIVPTATVPKNYEYNTEKGEWGYWDYETVIKPSGRKTVTKVWKSASVETIPAGTGFWYLNGGDSKDINL